MKEFFGALVIAVVFCGVGSLAGYNSAQREAREKIEAAQKKTRAESLGSAKLSVDLEIGRVFTVMATVKEESGRTAAIVMTDEGRLIFVEGLTSDLSSDVKFVKVEGGIAMLK